MNSEELNALANALVDAVETCAEGATITRSAAFSYLNDTDRWQVMFRKENAYFCTICDAGPFFRSSDEDDLTMKQHGQDHIRERNAKEEL